MKPTMLVIRDPDHENEYVLDADLDVITVDIGSQWRDFKQLAAALEDEKPEALEWVEGVREDVAHLPEDHPARVRVEELITTAQTYYD